MKIRMLCETTGTLGEVHHCENRPGLVEMLRSMVPKQFESSSIRTVPASDELARRSGFEDALAVVVDYVPRLTGPVAVADTPFEKLPA